MIQIFNLQFILHAHNLSLEKIKSSLAEFGKVIEVADCQDALGESRNYRINLETEEPTLVFDVCSQFGRIKSMKINEEKER